MATSTTPLDGQTDDPTVPTRQIKPPTAPVAAPGAMLPGVDPQPQAPTTTSPLPLSGAQPIAPVSSSDPLAFATSPIPLSSVSSNLSPVNAPTMTPGAPAASPAASAPAASTGYGGTGKYGDLPQAEAVQAAYRDQQAQAAATGIDATPIDYSAQGLSDAGLWGMSDADKAANAARTQQIQNDPASTAAAKSLAGLSGYGTAGFDQALNNGSNPELATQVQNLLGQSAAQHVPTPGPTGEDYLVGGAHYSNFADALKAEQQGAAPGAAGAAGGAGGAGTPARSITPGAANDVNPSGSIPLGAATMNAGGSGPGASPSGGGTSSSNGGVTLTPTDPNNPLTAQTITPGPATDRFKIAQDQFQNFTNASDPAYQASLRDATRNAFGAGRGVSGQLRTSLGDYANNRATQLDAQRKNFLDSALTGSIDDAYKNIGIAQQQQGFQSGQQQTAFNQAAQQAQLEEMLTNGAFGRAQSQEQAGYQNDPSNIALLLSSIFGQQATGAGQAAAGLFQQAGKGSTSDPSGISEYLKLLGIDPSSLLSGQRAGGTDIPPAMGQ